MVHGCFWHGHKECKFFKVPSTRTQWWQDKINANKTRDSINESKLRELGWDVMTIYECELKPKKIEETLKNLLIEIRNGHTSN
jgi:DNA mismatch endonuclease (patch repair protein)